MVFKLDRDVTQVIPQAIGFNYDELKAALTEQLSKYQGMVVVKGDKADAKKARSSLNSLSKALNDNRIVIGKEWNAPLDAFKKQVDELIALAKEPAAEIDKQIKAIEQVEREDKRKEIADYFHESGLDAKVAGLGEGDQLHRFFDDKWLNSSATMANIKKELSAKVTKVAGELKTVEAMDVKHKDVLQAEYLRTLDIGTALAAREAHENTLATRAKALADSAVPAPPEPTYSAPAAPEVQPVPAESRPNVRTVEILFENTTKPFRLALKKLCAEHNITFTGVTR